jgi:hypothetical protein
MTEATNDHRGHPSPGLCENCATVLQGGYCHVCGQRAHNPLHDFAHAVEEVFESLWHLDGRIFRTLRDIFAPGRLAANYLAGQRVRYIAPLRLFIILSLITFFVGKLVLHVPPDEAGTGRSGAIHVTESDPDDFAKLTTPAAVIAHREARLRDFYGTVVKDEGSWVLRPMAGAVQADIDTKTRERLQALGQSEAQIAEALARSDDALAGVRKAADKRADLGDGIMANWIEGRVERMHRNIEVANTDPDSLLRSFLGAVPGALFLLVPLFALFLKVLYLGSGRGYLEHLMIALYSHCFLLILLLAMFCVIAVRNAADGAPWGEATFGIGTFVVWVWIGIYLLRMQKRVYAQGWPMTLLKYTIVGSVYTVLLVFALLYALLAGLTS